MTRIAVVGMACRYPDATSARELWENALAGRRAFRRLPDVRMRMEDYWDPDPTAPDRFYARTAAVIEGFEFDRVAYKIAGSTYRSTDLTHWLALDVAALALADAGFAMGEGLPRVRTGVVIGNSLTGEFSRANQMRLRWPYVRRVVAAALEGRGWAGEALATFLEDLEASYKDPFPAIDEDTLAGALSNTIAGRICNYFDLKGGGYTVDGACSSSLLSIVTACKALGDQDIDVALAGGVDLSIDPFEIIGFAKTGALASGEMRVYDRASNGFWPGEGAGMVVLMRESDAVEAGQRIYATIAGWGISSDGKGGITRPEITGYQLALRRAYERSGFGIETVAMVEGHGTGTKVGDTTELTALSQSRAAADPHARPAAIGSIKGMIGHTKAAAGVAGLIKAAMAVHHEVIPPTVGCVEPHEVFAAQRPALRVLRQAEAWPSDLPVRAGVTAMGFGGINTHIVLENSRPRRRSFDRRTRSLASSIQDVELLLIDAGGLKELRERLDQLIEFVPVLSYSQLGDLAATLHHGLRGLPYRAAVVVSSPEDAQRRLHQVRQALEEGQTRLMSPDGRSVLGHARAAGRVGFLFPGQGSGRGTSGGALRRRFADVDQVYATADLRGGDTLATELAQPRIVTGSVAGLRTLFSLGIHASVAVGHSLGELTALHWAGALDEIALLRIARLRGEAMAEHSASGTMASISASPELVEQVTMTLPVVIAGYNGPNQTVIAGGVDAVQDACARAAQAGLESVRLPVSHAFHSPLVAPAAQAFGAILANERFGPLSRPVVSTVTGDGLAADTDVVGLLRRQVVEPVLFTQAIALAAKDVELFVEVGPGSVLAALAMACTDVPAVSLDTDSESLESLLRVVAAAYTMGASDVGAELFYGRLVRPLPVGAPLTFLESPCEQAPTPRTRSAKPANREQPPAATEDVANAAPAAPTNESTMELLRRLAARRAELPLELVRADSLLLDDLHLSSITVGQLTNQAAQQLGLPPAQVPTGFATASLRQLAEALDVMAATTRSIDAPQAPTVAGAAAWARAWSVDFDEVALPARAAGEESGPWRVYADAEHPFAEPLRRSLEHANVGSGVLVCLPENCPLENVQAALLGAKAAAQGAAGSRFLLVQHGRGAAGLAKTLRLEAPHTRVTIVHVPPVSTTSPASLVDWTVAEVAATTTFAEAYYDAAGVRRVPTLHAMPVQPARIQPPLDGTDVLLVTGGGKGITAECTLAMAMDSGAKVALLGRADPAADPELSANLKRMADAGVTVRYARADVTDPAAVRRAVHELTAALGPVTAVLHGAGRNEPASLTTLDMNAVRDTCAPKIEGLRAVMDAIEPERLRLLVTLGSIIGRSGLRGEAHYAVANEWLADVTLDFGRRYPRCRSLCLEWSVWSGVGMGERLSVVESLAREGVTPITPDSGVAILRRLVADPDAPGAVVISGRTEGVDTIRHHRPELPLLRFLQRPLIRYHGVELVAETELNAGTDLYLADHLLDGNLLFPAVFGMEAMAQAAIAVTGLRAVPIFERVEFPRPIVVPPSGDTTIRVAVVVSEDDTVDAVIQSSETGFAAEHFRARLRFTGAPAPDGPPAQTPPGLPPVPLEPAADLYGDTLFQGGRFQRLRRYHRVAARNVDVEVDALDAMWFATYLPATLVLGDPGVRDTLMHGNQVCVPDATLLPAAIERVYPAGDRIVAGEELRYCATERSQHGDTYVYDIALRNGAGEMVERWEGLHLKAVRRKDSRGPWVASLLGPYLQRSIEELLGAHLAIAVEPDPTDLAPTGPPEQSYVEHRRERTALVAGRVLGRAVQVRYRPDGRPEIDGDVAISAAHGAGVTMCAIAEAGVVGCDVEEVTACSASAWQGLLGPHAGLAGLVTEITGEDDDTAATRVWAAMECLQKAGELPRAPLVLAPHKRDGWTVFSSGERHIATVATSLRGWANPVVFAILTERTR